MLVNILLITNTIFNAFFGLTCGLIGFTMIKNRRALKNASKVK